MGASYTSTDRPYWGHAPPLLQSRIRPWAVSVLWREEGYTVKYSLSTREIPRAEPEGFPKGWGYISLYILTWVIIQTFSISKSFTSSIVLLVGQYWSWFSVFVWQLGYIFPYCPVDKAIWVRIDPVENSVVAALGNIHGQESNIILFSYWECHVWLLDVFRVTFTPYWPDLLNVKRPCKPCLCKIVRAWGNFELTINYIFFTKWKNVKFLQPLWREIIQLWIVFILSKPWWKHLYHSMI